MHPYTPIIIMIHPEVAAELTRLGQVLPDYFRISGTMPPFSDTHPPAAALYFINETNKSQE